MTEALGDGQLCPSSPPLPAQEADLVGHHALLELVFRCHRAAHVTGAALEGGDLHHVVHKGQREAQAAQDVRVLLLWKGCQGGVTGKLLSAELCQQPTPAHRNNTSPPEPLTPLLWAKLSLKPAPVPPPQ